MTTTTAFNLSPISHKLNIQDAEELETLQVIAEIAGDEYFDLLQESKELTKKIAAKRIDYLKKHRDYQELAKVIAAMTGGAA